jgi:hypothetical protein
MLFLTPTCFSITNIDSPQTPAITVYGTKNVQKTYTRCHDNKTERKKKEIQHTAHYFNIILTRIQYNDKVKKGQMDRICSAHGKEEEFLQGFHGKVKRKKTTRKI